MTSVSQIGGPRIVDQAEQTRTETITAPQCRYCNRPLGNAWYEHRDEAFCDPGCALDHLDFIAKRTS